MTSSVFLGRAYGDFVRTPTLKVQSPLLPHGGAKPKTGGGGFARSSDSLGFLKVPTIPGQFQQPRNSPRRSPNSIQDRLVSKPFMLENYVSFQ